MGGTLWDAVGESQSVGSQWAVSGQSVSGQWTVAVGGSFVPSFVPSFVHSFVPSFLRSFVRCSFLSSLSFFFLLNCELPDFVFCDV